MGGAVRCARCKKGISDNEKAAFDDEGNIFHKKCLERNLRGKK